MKTLTCQTIHAVLLMSLLSVATASLASEATSPIAASVLPTSPTLLASMAIILLLLTLYHSKHRKLRRTEQIQQTVLDTVTDGIITTCSLGKIIHANQAALSLFGYSTSELLGKEMTHLLPDYAVPKHTDMAPDLENRAITKVPLPEREIKARRRDGSEFKIRITICMYRKNTQEMFTCTLSNSFDEVGNQPAWSGQESMLPALLNATDQFVLIFDREGNLVMINDPALHSLGKTRQSLIGKNILNIRSPSLPTLRMNRLLEASRLRQPQPDEEYISGHWYEVRYCPMSDSNRHIAVFAKNISQIKALEESLSHAKKQVFNSNLVTLRFLSRLSQVLQRPLNSIQSISRMMITDSAPVLSTSQPELLAGMGANIQQLVNDFLDVARFDAGRLDIPVTVTEIDPVIDECFHITKPLADKANLQFIIERTAQLPHALTHPSRLKQILLTILTNAIKYNRSGGVVLLRIVPEGNAISLSVTDNGYGIPETKQKTLFSTINRFASEHSETEDSGIGLVLCRALAHAIQARIGFSSSEGKGSEFWIEVPVAAPTAIPASSAKTDGTEENRQATAVKIHPQKKQGQSVLYVTPNSSSIGLIETLIQRYEHHKLITAVNPTEGVRLAQNYDFDLILLDHHPQNEIHQEFENTLFETRSLYGQRERQPPIIALTTEQLDQRSDNNTFDAYLTKPIDVTQFLTTLRKHLFETV